MSDGAPVTEGVPSGAEIDRLHAEQRRLNDQIHAQKATVQAMRQERDKANKKARTAERGAAGQQRARQAAEAEAAALLVSLTEVRAAASAVLEAWGENWTCSRTPGHGGMTGPIEALYLLLNPAATTDPTGGPD